MSAPQAGRHSWLPPINPVQIVGSPQYVANQAHKLKQHLASQPEPQLGDPDVSARIRESVAFWDARMDMAQSHIDRHAPAIDPRAIYALHEARFFRDLVYWRLFRINDLPPEILVNIFRYVVWSTSNPTDGVHYRLWLTWICQRWRALMIGDLTLWNAIWFRDRPPYERSLAWLNRAGTAPLDLRINEQDEKWTKGDTGHRFTGEQMSDLLDKVFVKLSQIRMLVVIVDNWPPALVVLHKLQEAGRAGIPINMDRFEIHRSGRPYVWIGPGYMPDSHRNPTVLFGGRITSLNYLCLNGIHIDWNNSPVRNLTNLDLRRMPLDVSPTLARFQEILRNCPMLFKLALDGAGPAPEEKQPGHIPVDLLHLKILVLGDFSLMYALYVLMQLNAPNVRDFTVMNMTGEDYTPLLSALTSRFKEVRLLTIYTVELGITPQAKRVLVRWLNSMPNISYLRIAAVMPHVLDALLADPRQHGLAIQAAPAPGATTRQIVCPNFKILEFQSVPTPSIIALAQARKQLDVPLSKIYVNSPWIGEIKPEEVEKLRTLADLYIAPLGTNTPEEAELMN
ncbi:hypothetical protein BJ138DRAFT_1052779 [Hygrophoropsis aurantiaca]|uniref:Uncharacterized protein n=1 Tax=Hygrophoropsis aurantiaca TaxID=72124 RepID=A0ACB8ASG1_9AGAM|nr:hypothetical protein BJ138DRAFT_1052779 [Hygrophoropsis aurantiaca]